jgi:hypothetical protein
MEQSRESTGNTDDSVVTRSEVERVLARVGVSQNIAARALDSIRFPAARAVVCRRLEGVGLGLGQLKDMMGGSP